MSDFWVINTSNLKKGENKDEKYVDDLVNIMIKEHICLFGYFEDSGQTFRKIKIGDVIIVSQRISEKSYQRSPDSNYFVGIVDSDAYDSYEIALTQEGIIKELNKDRSNLVDTDTVYKFQYRKLKNFKLLKGKKLTFKEDSEDYPTVQPIYKLKKSNDKDKILIEEIKKIMDVNMIKECKELLEQNYNLILTGAPGTGKTYLAKQIAAKIIFDDDKKEYTEELEEDENFKNQYEFVQFHPSYDYTDFVEGLRPIKDSSGNIGFERKDGVFKEFCKKALKNLIDSKKDISQLNEDAIIKNNLLEFIDYISIVIDEKGCFEIEGINRKAAPLKEIELNDETLYFVPDIKADKPIKLTLDKLVEFYKKFSGELKINKKWDYQNFIAKFGLKGQHTYVHGFLKAFYEKYNSEIEKELNNNNTVEKVEKKNFVFIIDEINRGEISKIFGELFFAIDPGYRGVKGKVLTQYSNLIDEELEKYFYIPENVYIMGTMNDIDRSVESMDFAMRRRFAWKEVNAKDTQESILKDLDDSIKQDAIDRMNALNNAISEIEGFNSSYHIGASYFLKLKNYYNGNNKEDAFKSLWDNHLKGLLFEYLRGMPDINDKLKKLEYSYNVLPANNTKQDTNDNNIDN
ncbi:AAA family ATPase [Brachyspira pilosicoli]|uniref:McrB family protein n=1 Tax=Brachyspira pilosicoli TaxID=52584 RepID=UPI003005F923